MALFGRTKQQALAAIAKNKRKRTGGGLAQPNPPVVPTVPATATAPVLTAANNAISVAYTVPYDGGSAILEAQFTDNNGVVTTLTGSPQVIAKTAGVPVTGTVRFRNSVGWSDYSAQSNQVTPTSSAQSSNLRAINTAAFNTTL